MVDEVAVGIRDDYCWHIFTQQEATSFFHSINKFQTFKAFYVIFHGYSMPMQCAKGFVHDVGPTPSTFATF